MNLTLRNPDGSKFEKVHPDQLEELLSSKSLSCRRSVSNNRVTVFSSAIEVEIQRFERGELLVISTFRSIRALIAELRELLNDGQEVVISPSPALKREIMGPWWFIRRMDQIRGQLPEAEVFIPAGLYGSVYLLGLRPKDVHTADGNKLCEHSGSVCSF